MAKYPIEVFGHNISLDTSDAKQDVAQHHCPFMDAQCDKQSRLIDIPFGVCSVSYNDRVIALCPRRFLQSDIVFHDIASHHFGSTQDIVVFEEVSLAGIGNFDFVLVKHKPMSSEIEDFVILELQTDQTTSTGKLVEAFLDMLNGEDIQGRTYGFGLNSYDAIKRAFIQMLTKGIVIESWGKKIYWVFQESLYDNFVSRYNLHDLSFDDRHSIVFGIYDFSDDDGVYSLVQTRMESSTVDNLFYKFRHNPNIPDIDNFIQSLSKKVSAKLGLTLDSS